MRLYSEMAHVFFTDDEVDTGNQASDMLTEQEYDCVICGQTSPSTADRPMGLVALAQSTSGGYTNAPLVNFEFRSVRSFCIAC